MTTSHKRRQLLKGSLATGLFGAAWGSGLIKPRLAMAAWQKTAFDASELADALRALTGQHISDTPSEHVTIKGPSIAEDRRSVHVKVLADLPDVDFIAILVPDNPFPLAASFELAPGVMGHLSTRIHMQQSGDVIAVARAGGRYHHARQTITVNPGENPG